MQLCSLQHSTVWACAGVLSNWRETEGRADSFVCVDSLVLAGLLHRPPVFRCKFHQCFAITHASFIKIKGRTQTTEKWKQYLHNKINLHVLVIFHPKWMSEYAHAIFVAVFVAVLLLLLLFSFAHSTRTVQTTPQRTLWIFHPSPWLARQLTVPTWSSFRVHESWRWNWAGWV